MNPFFKLSPSLKRDAIIIAAVCSILFLLFNQFAVLHTLIDNIIAFTLWDIHQFVFAVAVIISALAFFAFRRWRELQNEMSKRREIEKSLLESETRSKALLAAIPNLVFRINRSGTFLDFKADNEADLFVAPKKIIGSSIAEIMPKEFASRAMTAIQDALSTNQMQYFEYELPIQNIPQRFVARFVVSGTNEVLVLCRNINDTEAISEALVKSQTRFREVVESLNEGVIITDLLDKIVYINSKMSKICGWSFEEIKEKAVHQILLPQRRWNESVEKIINSSNGITAHFETEFIKKNGSAVWLEVFSSPYKDEHGAIIGTVDTVVDVTRRKWNERLQSALFRITEITQSTQELDEFFAKLHSVIGELMYAKNLYIAMHDKTSQIISFPYFADEINTVPAPKKFSNGSMERVLQSGEIFHSPRQQFLQMVERGETEFFGAAAVDWLGVPLKSGDTTFGALVVQSYKEEIQFGEKEKEILVFVSQHISRAIRQKFEEERFRAVWDHSTDGLRVTDNLGTIIMVNDAYCALAEKTKEELIGRPFEAAYSNDESAVMRSISMYRERFEQNLFKPRDERGMQLWNGKEKVFEISTSYIMLGINEKMLLTIFRDISERKKLEEQLMHAQKMDSIGVLAGGIAHDFNNVLSMIMGSADLIKSRTKNLPDISKFAQLISGAAERGSGIAKQLLLFARTEKSVMKPLSLSSAVTDVCKLLEHSLPKSISITFSAETSNDIVLGDEDQLHQVLINLAVNARDAIEQKSHNGTISFSVSEIRGEFLRSNFPLAHENLYVALRVRDNGCGMDEQTVQKIFEPFFTTKERGKGTGLGLSIVHGIVKNHKGIVDVKSSPRTGTEFTIYFPAALVLETVEEKPAAMQSAYNKISKKYGGKKILVVDDEAQIANTVCEELESEGYSVVTALNGEEALTIIRNQKELLALVVSDLGMPEMDGRELLKKSRAEGIKLDFIFMTGYLDQTSKSELLKLGAKQVLMKPFSLEDITRAVNVIIGE